MTSSLLLLMLSATGPVKAAAPAWSSVGLEPRLAAVFQERFVSRLGAPRLVVTSQRDIEQMLGLERQRQLLGCETESSSCLAELAGALGVDVVISGSLARSESGFIVALRALRTSDGKPLATPNARPRTEGELLDWLDDTADHLRATILETLRPEEAPGGARLALGLSSGALLLGGAACLTTSGIQYLRLTSSTALPLGDVHGVRTSGEVLLPIGAVLAGVGALGLVTTLLWPVFSPRPTPVQASVVPLRDGAALTFGGRLP